MKLKSISIVIPVYNESKYISHVIEKVFTADTGGLKKEVIVVDDGSTDATKDQLLALKKRYSIAVLDGSVNHGKGAALRKGFSQTAGDVVLVQDADREYDPSDYPLLIEPFLKQGADVVFGSRFVGDRPHRVLYYWHSLANWLLTTFSNMLTNLNLTDMETGYKAFKGSIIRKIAPSLKSDRFGFEPEIIARIAKIPSIKIYEVGISYTGRTYEEGKKIGWRDGVRAIAEIIYYNLFVK
ncbi:glycosyltransferase family 2 protein [Candidatus Roizmanbacteria bacterium]|nr:glycosyltransferase family 2 protein [Candidatus Roizmanbacteria bacterium]